MLKFFLKWKRMVYAKIWVIQHCDNSHRKATQFKIRSLSWWKSKCLSINAETVIKPRLVILKVHMGWIIPARLCLLKGHLFSLLVQVRCIMRLQYQLRKLLPWVSVREKDMCHVTPPKDQAAPCSVEAETWTGWFFSWYMGWLTSSEVIKDSCYHTSTGNSDCYYD